MVLDRRNTADVNSENEMPSSSSVSPISPTWPSARLLLPPRLSIRDSAAPGGASNALSKFMNDTRKAHSVDAWSIQPAACMTTKPAPPAKGWTYFQCKGWA